MKYGSSFAERVYDDYFRLGFEGEGMEKVVDTLIKKNSDNQEEDRQEPQKKKLKVKYG
jgi:hypothetical protein